MEFKKEIMSRQTCAFYHLIPNPSPQGEGSRHPSQSRRVGVR